MKFARSELLWWLTLPNYCQLKQHLGTQSHNLMLQLHEGAHLWNTCAVYHLMKDMAINLRVLACATTWVYIQAWMKINTFSSPHTISDSAKVRVRWDLMYNLWDRSPSHSMQKQLCL